MTPMPDIGQIKLAWQPFDAYLQRTQAIKASAGTPNPLPEIDFTKATVFVGDGGGAIPNLSDIIAAKAVSGLRAQGQYVQGVSQNAVNPDQLDILCVLPAVDGTGAEIGPFWATNIIITDEAGTPMIAGVSAMPKFTAVANSQPTDLAFIASIALAIGTVVMQAPSAAFASLLDVQNAFKKYMPTATAPLTQTDATDAKGWLSRVFGLRAARQPGANVVEADATGYGRPATDAEVANGAPAAGGFAWPWPTLQQFVAATRAYISGVGVSIDDKRAVNLDYDPLIPQVPGATDVFAFLRPKTATTPAAVFKTALSSMLNAAGVGIAIGADRTTNLDYTRLGDLAPTKADYVAVYDAAAGQHGRAPLASVLGLNGPGTDVGAFADILVQIAGFSSPDKAGYVAGGSYPASNLLAGVFNGTNANAAGATGLNGANVGGLSGYPAPSTTILGAVTGTWKLVQWTLVGSASTGSTSNYILRFQRVL